MSNSGMLLVINPLLDNYLAHLEKHHWQHNFKKVGNIYFSQQLGLTDIGEC
jgi:hypothetical protein